MEQLFTSNNTEIQKRLLRLESAIKSPCFLSGLVFGSVANDLAKEAIEVCNEVQYISPL